MLRVQVGICVCASSQCPAGLHSWQGAQTGMEDGQADGTCVTSWWDGSGLSECPISEEVSCGSLHSCCEGSPDSDACPYRCSLLVLENSLRQTVDLYLSLLWLLTLGNSLLDHSWAQKPCTCLGRGRDCNFYSQGFRNSPGHQQTLTAYGRPFLCKRSSIQYCWAFCLSSVGKGSCLKEGVVFAFKISIKNEFIFQDFDR